MIALYTRVSTAEQARDGYSIGEQTERLQTYCKAMKWHGTKPYTDAGYSGGNTNRPALREMIKDIKAGKITKVIVYKLDRLSRSQKDTLELIEGIFLANGVDFLSMTENFDTSTPFGKAMIGILAVFAQLEREQIKERVTIGREGRAKNGLWQGGGHVPIGYDYKDGHLIVNDYEAMQIREMYELFQKGHNFQQIAEIFNDKGYSHKYGQWYAQRVKDILLNDIYCGMIKFGGKSYKGAHEPIVDEDTYNNVQMIYATLNTRKYPNRSAKAYLAGKVFCARCGARYGTAISGTKGKNYNYYVCYSRRKINKFMVKDPNCKNSNWRREELENVIFDEMRGLVLDHDNIRKDKAPADDKKEAAINKELEKISVKRSRLIDLYSIGSISADEISAKIEELNEKAQKLETELESLREGKTADAEVSALITSIGDILDRGVYKEIKLLINALIERIDLDGEVITITWSFS